MNKQEYLEMLWLSEKEWNYNLEIAYVFRNLIQNTNPIIRAMKTTANMILDADDIKRNIGVEIETEDELQTYSLTEAITKANSILRYDINGSNTRAYYYENRKKRVDKLNKHLFTTLFRQSLLKEQKGIINDAYYKNTLRFIEAGCNAVKFQ